MVRFLCKECSPNSILAVLAITLMSLLFCVIVYEHYDAKVATKIDVDNFNLIASKIAQRPIDSVDIIPRIIHQSWKSKDRIPSQFTPWIQSWKKFNPGWLYMFWDDNENLAFIKSHFLMEI